MKMKLIELYDIEATDEGMEFRVRMEGIERGCDLVWKCDKTGIKIRSYGFPEYMHDKNTLYIPGKAIWIDNEPVTCSYSDFANVCETVRLFNEAHKDAPEPPQLTPEQIKAACELEVRRRGLNVDIREYKYGVDLADNFYPYLHYDKSIPTVVLGEDNDHLCDTIQEAVIAFIDEVEQVVKLKPEKDEDGWKEIESSRRLRSVFRVSADTGSVFIASTKMHARGNAVAAVGKQERVPLARVLCNGMGYTVTNNDRVKELMLIDTEKPTLVCQNRTINMDYVMDFIAKLEERITELEEKSDGTEKESKRKK